MCSTSNSTNVGLCTRGCKYNTQAEHTTMNIRMVMHATLIGSLAILHYILTKIILFEKHTSSRRTT
eukprot:m.20284 g.20284  ORF g.20284 m.20284 type:complete len:66 (+) comp6796_c0_seq1:3578-3775(+)